jgi:hypothetical protein
VLLVTLSFALALAAMAALLVIPFYDGVTASSAVSGGEARPAVARPATLVEVNGPWVVWLLAAPVLVAGAPLALGGTGAWRPACVVAALLLVGLSALGAFSIGLYYLPSALAMAAASGAAFLTRDTTGAGTRRDSESRAATRGRRA